MDFGISLQSSDSLCISRSSQMPSKRTPLSCRVCDFSNVKKIQESCSSKVYLKQHSRHQLTVSFSKALETNKIYPSSQHFLGYKPKIERIWTDHLWLQHPNDQYLVIHSEVQSLTCQSFRSWKGAYSVYLLHIMQIRNHCLKKKFSSASINVKTLLVS